MDRKGLLIVVSGPSGAGKGTICKEFMKNNQDIRLSVSSTTRSPRDQEVEGVSYHFTTKENFEHMIERDELLEFVHVFGNYYGTGRQWVTDCLNQGQDVLLEIEIVGAMRVKEKYPDALLVFVLPPSLKELKERIKSRGTEDKQQIDGRMARAMEEIRCIEAYDYFILNEDLAEAVTELDHIVKGEKNRVFRHKDEILAKYERESYAEDLKKRAEES